MKRKLLLTGNIIGAILVISLFFSARYIFSNIFQDISNSSAVGGIIGGSDGPTAVFLSGPTNLNTGILFLLPTLFVGMLLILNVVYLIRNR